MPEMIVEWRIAGWAENILVVMIGLAMAGLAIWLVLQAVKDTLDRYARVEKLRLKKNDKALQEWMEAYREEHKLRIVAEKKAEQERSMRQQLAKGAENAWQETT